jgi:hypothetical protein
MPIHQDRIIDLAAAARDFYETWNRARQAIRESCQDAFAGKITDKEAVQEIEGVLDSWQPNPASIILMAQEEQHFKDTAASNILARRRQAKRRGKNPDDPITLRAIPRRQVVQYMREQQPANHQPTLPTEIDPSQPKPGVPTMDQMRELAERAEAREAAKPRVKNPLESTHTIQEGGVTIERIMEPIPEPDPDAPLIG